MEKLSVFVTTYNNDKTLAACLDSVKWADEIVLLDSFSDDQTLEIARQFGCQIFQHQFMGYGPQKQMALEHTNHDYVLLMDADEVLSPALQKEIQALRTLTRICAPVLNSFRRIVPHWALASLVPSRPRRRSVCTIT